MKAERVIEGRHITDTLDGQGFVNGQKYLVTFPDGTRKKMPAIVLNQVMVQPADPAIVMREQVFFAVRHHGLDQVWVRAIDVPNIRMIQDDKDDAETPDESPPVRKRK